MVTLHKNLGSCHNNLSKKNADEALPMVWSHKWLIIREAQLCRVIILAEITFTGSLHSVDIFFLPSARTSRDKVRRKRNKKEKFLMGENRKPSLANWNLVPDFQD